MIECTAWPLRVRIDKTQHEHNESGVKHAPESKRGQHSQSIEPFQAHQRGRLAVAAPLVGRRRTMPPE